MSPPASIKHLYAAFAENPSCGPASYYEESMQCGGGTSYDATASNNGPTIVKKRTFDGSLEVGILSDGEVFETVNQQEQGHTLLSSPRKEEGATPDTSPNSSPEPSLDDDLKEDSLIPFDEADSGGGHHPQRRDGPQCPSLNSLEGRYAGPVLKKKSFQDSSNNSCGSSSKQSRSTTPDSIERARGMTFRNNNEKRSIPNSVSATLSKSSSTLSHTVSCHNEESDYVSSAPSPYLLATSNMFTKEDLDAITPLQISTYLSASERQKIGTKVLNSKLSEGYTLSGGGYNVCNGCTMPKLCSASGKVAENNNCAICLLLKKHVLKKILDAAAPMASTSPQTGDLSDAITGLTLRRGVKQHGYIGVPGIIGPGESDACRKNVSFARINAGESANCTTHTPTGGDGQDNENSFPKQDNFILEAKAYYDSLKSSLMCNFNYEDMEVPEAAEHAREVLAKKIVLVSETLKESAGVTKCQEMNFEDHKEAATIAGEMIAKKVALVPDALKYNERKVIDNCRGLKFKEVRQVTAHAVETLTENVECLPDALKKSKNQNVVADDLLLVENEKDDGLADLKTTSENRIDRSVALADQDDQDDYEENVIVEDASEDAGDEDGLLDNQGELKNGKVGLAEDHDEKTSEDVPNGPAVTELQPQGNSSSSTAQDQPPFPTISTSLPTSHGLLAKRLFARSSGCKQSFSQQACSPSSSGSVSSCAKSISSEAAQSVASNSLLSLLDTIEQTKERMIHTEDVDEQTQCAELLAKLSSAAVALKKLEEVA